MSCFDVKALIGETTEYDKKQALEEKKPKSWCKSVSAFANGMDKIMTYLREHDGAKTREIAESIDLSPARTRALLNSMDDVIATGEYVNRRYWIKK